jgi:hypothetical protein
MARGTSTRRYRKLNEKQWAEVQARYEVGHKVKDIARDYDISPATICNHAKGSGWKPHGSVKDEAVEEARAEIKESFKTAYTKRGKEATERHYKIFSAIQRIGSGFLTDIAHNQKALKAGKSDEVRPLRKSEVHLLNSLTNTMRTAIEGERLVLNLDKLNVFEEEDGFDRLCEMIADERDKEEDAPEGDEDGGSD